MLEVVFMLFGDEESSVGPCGVVKYMPELPVVVSVKLKDTPGFSNLF